ENSANSGLFNEFSRKLKDKRARLKRQVISAQSLSTFHSILNKDFDNVAKASSVQFLYPSVETDGYKKHQK
ncbi:MAG: hypothetical protein WCS11_07850, partial [Dysgonamonadaceae bacterium]